MANSSHVHQVGLVPSAVDPTIKSSTSAPVGSDPKERFLELERLTSSYLDDKDRALLEKAFRFADEMHAGQKRKSGEAKLPRHATRVLPHALHQHWESYLSLPHEVVYQKDDSTGMTPCTP